ncbi:GTP cyclohydrolase FolE2 [candidate division KSB1 bacterium]|jgi:GTP cyclohydrolase I|nr:GTP cyclohydrolase FolE2 [candidate division KSB1 bacterium]
MHDVQAEVDPRNIMIDKVGVKNLRYPIVLSDKAHQEQHTVANINMYVNLPHHYRGTHMSRFIEILNKYRREIAIRNMGAILKEMKDKLQAESAHLDIEFPYFIEKAAPVSGAKSLMEYRCRFVGNLTTMTQLFLEITVPITTVCPCSKEISKFGAHNQRAIIRVRVRFKGFLWIEDLIELVENCGSSPVYSLLKREDEKVVTENAYQHPTFVEDVVRNVAEKLNKIEHIPWYCVEVESYESIHNHDAYALIEKKEEI